MDLRTSACGGQEHLQGPRLHRAALAVVWAWESRLRWLLRLSRSRQVPYILCAEATEHGLPLEGGGLGSGVSFGLGCSLKGPQLWPALLPRRGALGSCPVPTTSHLGRHSWMQLLEPCPLETLPAALSSDFRHRVNISNRLRNFIQNIQWKRLLKMCREITRLQDIVMKI